MELYRLAEDDLRPITETEIDDEATLETHLTNTTGATIGGVDILYIHQQGQTNDGQKFDIRGVDREGNIVIVELKRDRSPRKLIAQGLEYVAGHRAGYDYDDLDAEYRQYANSGASLRTAHAEYFDLEEPLERDEFNEEQRLVLVTKRFSKRILNVADLLRDHDLDIICVEYSSFTDGNQLDILSTKAVRRSLSEEPDGSEGTSKTRSGTRTTPLPQLVEAIFSQVYQELADTLEATEKDDVLVHNDFERAGLQLRSNHEGHPESVIYSIHYRMRDADTFYLGMGISPYEDEEVIQILRDHYEETAFEYDEVKFDRKTEVLRKEWSIEIEDLEVRSADDIFQTLEDGDQVSVWAREFVDMIAYWHPILVEESSRLD